MDRKILFKYSAYLVIFIAFINFFANKFYWYYSIWWFDMPMHFLGGVWVGLIVIWLLTHSKSIAVLDKPFIYKVLLGVLLLGVGWEIFEIVFNNVIAGQSFNILDTVSDVFFDLAGGTTATLYFAKKIMTINEKGVQ